MCCCIMYARNNQIMTSHLKLVWEPDDSQIDLLTFTLPTHSVEISWIFCHLEIKFGNSKSAKSAIIIHLWILIFMNFCTLWRLKFTDLTKFRAPQKSTNGQFSITQNLCEIKFWDSISEKSAISTHLEALNFYFYFFHLV